MVWSHDCTYGYCMNCDANSQPTNHDDIANLVIGQNYIISELYDSDLDLIVTPMSVVSDFTIFW